MSAALDRHGDVVRFGVLEGSNDVGITGRLHNQGWVHVVVNAMGARCILIIIVFVGLAVDGTFRRADVLDAFEVLDGRHVDQLYCDEL